MAETIATTGQGIAVNLPESLDIERFEERGVLVVPDVFSESHVGQVLGEMFEVMDALPHMSRSRLAELNEDAKRLSTNVHVSPENPLRAILLENIFAPLGAALMQSSFGDQFAEPTEEIAQPNTLYVVRYGPNPGNKRRAPVHSDTAAVVASLAGEGIFHEYATIPGTDKVRHVEAHPTGPGGVVLLNSRFRRRPGIGPDMNQFHAGHYTGEDERWIATADRDENQVNVGEREIKNRYFDDPRFIRNPVVSKLIRRVRARMPMAA